jgi:hypothetical protein
MLEPIPMDERPSLIPDGLPEQRRAILQAALADIGLAEEAVNRGRIEAGRGIDRFQPVYIRDDPKAPGIPYCASAVCTWWNDALDRHPLHKLVRGADALKDVARGLSMWRDVPCVPTPGDAFVYLHSVDRPGFDKGHTGLVLRVSDDGTSIETIEANCGNRVRLVLRKFGTKLPPGPEQILGFASPIDGPAPTGWQRGLSGKGQPPPAGTR